MLRGGEAWQWLPKLRWNRWVFGGWSTWSGRDSKFWGRQSTRLLITDHSLASGLGRTCVVFQKYLYTLTPKNANNFIGWGILLFKGMYWLGMACWSFSARIVRLERQIGDAAYLQPSIRRLAHAKNPVSDGNHKHLWNGQRFLKPDPDDTTDISAVLIFLSEPRSTLDILDDKESSVRPSTCAEQAAIATGCPFHLLRCLSSMDQKNQPPIPRVQPKNHGAVPMSTATSSLFGRYERFPQQNSKNERFSRSPVALLSSMCLSLHMAWWIVNDSHIESLFYNGRTHDMMVEPSRLDLSWFLPHHHLGGSNSPILGTNPDRTPQKITWNRPPEQVQSAERRVGAPAASVQMVQKIMINWDHLRKNPGNPEFFFTKTPSLSCKCSTLFNQFWEYQYRCVWKWGTGPMAVFDGDGIRYPVFKQICLKNFKVRLYKSDESKIGMGSNHHMVNLRYPARNGHFLGMRIHFQDLPRSSKWFGGLGPYEVQADVPWQVIDWVQAWPWGSQALCLMCLQGGEKCLPWMVCCKKWPQHTTTIGPKAWKMSPLPPLFPKVNANERFKSRETMSEMRPQQDETPTHILFPEPILNWHLQKLLPKLLDLKLSPLQVSIFSAPYLKRGHLHHLQDDRMWSFQTHRRTPTSSGRFAVWEPKGDGTWWSSSDGHGNQEAFLPEVTSAEFGCHPRGFRTSFPRWKQPWNWVKSLILSHCSSFLNERAILVWIHAAAAGARTAKVLIFLAGCARKVDVIVSSSIMQNELLFIQLTLSLFIILIFIAIITTNSAISKVPFWSNWPSIFHQEKSIMLGNSLRSSNWPITVLDLTKSSCQQLGHRLTSEALYRFPTSCALRRSRSWNSHLACEKQTFWKET